MKLSELARQVTLRAVPGTRIPFEKLDRWQKQSSPWTCTLTFQGRRLTVDYFQGHAVTEKPDSPNVLSSLLSDASFAQLSFEEFCGELGYETSKEARKTYRACLAMATKLEKLLGNEYQTFMSSENDV